MDKKIYVTLENGKVFEGYSFGAEKETVGELVFATGAIDYIETLTDPCYHGQIVAQTFPLIGNYGMIFADKASNKCQVSAYVVREKCDKPSNFRCEGTLEDYLKAQGVPAVYGIDTRELTRIIREGGVMNAAITFKPLKDTSALKSYCVKDAVQAVESGEKKTYGEGELSVALLDFGCKDATIDEFVRRGCKVIQLPANTSAEEILSLGVNGVVLSEGPGNPTENERAIQTVKSLLGKKPVFGVGLGHQILALAAGGKTKKMKYGHHGGNQPVRNVKAGGVVITSQNHGYEVVSDSLKGIGEVTYLNVNDGSCEGVLYPSVCAIGVQFQPSTCGGPHNANVIYDEFIAMMKEEK